MTNGTDTKRDPADLIAERASALIGAGWAQGKAWRQANAEVTRGARRFLLVADLRATLDDERHLGFGYAESRYLPDVTRARLDRAVVAVANDLEIDEEQLFLWSNSKLGRHLCDEASGRGQTRALVSRYLNAQYLDDLAKGL